MPEPLPDYFDPQILTAGLDEPSAQRASFFGQLAFPATDTSYISKAKFQEILIEKWIPGIVAVICVGLAIPWITNIYTHAQARETACQDRRYRVWEELAKTMSAWMNSRQRLIDYYELYGDDAGIEKALNEQKIEGEERKRAKAARIAEIKKQFADLDKQAREDALKFATAQGVAETFFVGEAQQAVKDFRAWHEPRQRAEQQAIANTSVHERLVLNSMYDYVPKRAALMETLGRNLKGDCR